MHHTSGGIGEAVLRREDARLISGKGYYSDDFSLDGQAYAVVVRSPHAHARVLGVTTDAAALMPGVLAILSGQDLIADGLCPIPVAPWSTHPADIQLPNRDGSAHFHAPQPLLAMDKVRFVGEGVAFVVAETMQAAKDAAEQVHVEYAPLPAVIRGAAAARSESPRVWDESSNVTVDSEVGNVVETEIAFGEAAHVVTLETWVQRVTSVPMEPRAAVASFESNSERYTLYTGGGGAIRIRNELAAVLNVGTSQVRVVIRDVGGNFGSRGGLYPEFALVAWAARRIGRPVKWTADRQECFLSDYQARDLSVKAELALDAKGHFLAVRGSSILNSGAYSVAYIALQKSTEVVSGLYHVPVAHWHARATLSNTPPTRPYRATGRPEAMFGMERLIDRAAATCGFDRLELRKLNLIPADALPYTNPFGMTYDNGLYHEALESALKLGQWDGFPLRRASADVNIKLRGIGIATYVDTGTGATRERTEITVQPNGFIDVIIGTVSNGQGHETSYAQLLTEWLGVSVDKMRLIAGDTDAVSIGGGSHSGRSMRLAALLMQKATNEIVARGTEIAAHLLEAAPSDIRLSDGHFVVTGTDRAVDLFAVAAAAIGNTRLPENLQGALRAVCDETVLPASFPYGAHVCEVEIDSETGVVEIVAYAAVDDVGRAVNPMIVHGQTHGGIAQGIGQALWEQCVYDAEGQLLTASFMDYGIPRASTLPSFATEISEVPASTHPLGIRSGGEGGTAPALAVVVNAIVDALSGYGVSHMEMPVTPERIWRTIRDAGKPLGHSVDADARRLHGRPPS